MNRRSDARNTTSRGVQRIFNSIVLEDSVHRLLCKVRNVISRNSTITISDQSKKKKKGKSITFPSENIEFQI